LRGPIEWKSYIPSGTTQEWVCEITFDSKDNYHGTIQDKLCACEQDRGKQPMMLMGFKILDQVPFGRIILFHTM